MRYHLKVAAEDFARLRALVFADQPKEAGAFALAGIARHAESAEILIRRPVEVPKQHFRIQHELHLQISAQAINGLIALCEKNELGAVLCHSHPQDLPYSRSDDDGERRNFDVLRRFIPRKAPTASLLFYPGGVRGRVWPDGRSPPAPITEIVVLGRSLQRIYPDGPPPATIAVEPMFDRQARAFGALGHALIAGTKVAIVGVGGTGSATAEQVARLGVRDLLLIDHDRFEPSNLSRNFGTFASNLRRPNLKVKLIAAHLRKINPKIRVRTIPKSVVLGEAATKLLDRDVIFLCTDEHWGRSVVNQIAYQYLIPTINMGMHIAAPEGVIVAAPGTVDVLRPDLPCLWCRQYLRPELIAEESMPRSAREERRREGYVEGVDTAAPSVVSINTLISGMAVTLFLQLATDFMGKDGAIARLNYDGMNGTVRRGTTLIMKGCQCGKVRAFGDLKPLPVQSDLRFLED